MSVDALRERLAKQLSGEVRASEPMARHTTFRIGGPADLYCVCDTLTDLSVCLGILAEERMPHVVLGKGSNVLVADRGYRGAVLVLGKEFRKHRIVGERILAGSACILAALVQEAYSQGLSGLEFAVGIPGTLGGALAMNAGSKDSWIQDVVDRVTVYSAEEGLLSLKREDVRWGYRRSDLSTRGVVVEAALRVRAGDPVRIRRSMESVFRTRKRTQPVGSPSAGSVFMNPPDNSAGRLVEVAGLKGATVGGAQVSTVHANFIVNAGGASAADVASLVRLMRREVRANAGVDLIPEIRFIGEFDPKEA